MRLFVGNLPFALTEEELKASFEAWDFQVIDAKIIVDRESQKSRGFGFVSVVGDEAPSLIGRRIGGRVVIVSEARRADSDGAGGRRASVRGGRGQGRGGRGRRGGDRDFWDK